MADPQNANVVRMNISVPRDLKARMDAATAYLLPGSVNWSAVASAAFEAKLLELASKKEVRGVKDVIARLRAADELDRNEDYRAGRAAGERWAEQKATAQQLRSLRRSVDESSGSLPAGFESVARDAASGTGPGVGWHVYFGTLGAGSREPVPKFKPSLLRRMPSGAGRLVMKATGSSPRPSDKASSMALSACGQRSRSKWKPRSNTAKGAAAGVFSTAPPRGVMHRGF